MSKVVQRLLRRRNLEYLFATVLSITVVILLEAKLSDKKQSGSLSSRGTANTTQGVDASGSNTGATNEIIQHNDIASMHERLPSATIVEQLPFTLDDDSQKLLIGGNTDKVTNDLLQKASAAVANGEYAELGRTIALLGSVTLLERDTESAAIYLEEALEIFEFEEDELGIAGVELLRGQLNIEKRWQAREAAYAYDAMQIAGWKIAHDRFAEAEVTLQQTIESNLDLNRYGAAAAGYDQLFRGYQKNGQVTEAMNAGIEAARLHAASGRSLKANSIVEKLDEFGIDEDSRRKLQQELRGLQNDYEQAIKQIGSARDYQQLYHHYINEGDPVRAWQFRLKSRQSLDGVSKRAMHRRQTGVIALLYTSNDQMKAAAKALKRAEQVFINHDADHLSDLSNSLKDKIY